MKRRKAPPGFPTSVELNGRKWRIQYVDKLIDDDGVTELAGCVERDKHLISIEVAGEQRMRDTLVHEVFHALYTSWYGSGLPEDDVGEERVILFATSALFEILKTGVVR